jgi:hypothetical protein
LTNTVSTSENQSCISQHVERAILPVGLEQPVEAQERGQQRADPQDRRADPRQEVQIRADAEGNHRHHGEKEQHAKHRRPARAGGDRQVTPEQRHHAQISPEAAL